MKRNQKGFTLAELLIVVAVIAVLVAVAIPTFGSQLEKSRQTVDISNLRGAYAAAKLAVINQEYANKNGEVIKLKKTGLFWDSTTNAINANYKGELYFWYEPSEGVLIEATTDGKKFENAPTDTNSLGQSRSTQLRADTSRLEDDTILYYNKDQRYTTDAETPTIGKPILVVFEEKGGKDATSVWQLKNIAFADVTGGKLTQTTVSSAGSAIYLGTVTSGTDGWSIEFPEGYTIKDEDIKKDGDWLTVTNKTSSVEFTATSNPGDEPKTASVTVTAKDANGNKQTKTKTFTLYSKLKIAQKADADGAWTVTTDSGVTAKYFKEKGTSSAPTFTVNLLNAIEISGGSGSYTYSATGPTGNLFYGNKINGGFTSDLPTGGTSVTILPRWWYHESDSVANAKNELTWTVTVKDKVDTANVTFIITDVDPATTP